MAGTARLRTREHRHPAPAPVPDHDDRADTSPEPWHSGHGRRSRTRAPSPCNAAPRQVPRRVTNFQRSPAQDKHVAENIGSVMYQGSGMDGPVTRKILPGSSTIPKRG